MHLGDATLTGGQAAERISQYVQAFEALGAGRGTAGALLALNRPEVLFILGAGQTQGYRRTSLHPLGSLDDHAYVINDAGITTLIIDPCRCSSSGRSALLEKCPGARRRCSRSARCPRSSRRRRPDLARDRGRALRPRSRSRR